ncbi:MAG: acyltransferase family protein [Actinomycetota bacterium]
MHLPPPPPPPAPPPPPPGARPVDAPSAPRRYDLDALRGVAMLLGIVLHAAIPFVPYYGADDLGGEILFGLFEYIHLWRMPLFFLLSGFFTTMLWRRRGLQALVHHRLRRIAAPLGVFYVPVIVLVIVGIVAGYAIADVDIENAAGVTDDYESPEDRDEREPDDESDAFSFAHMWFLWHLLWLVAVFAIAAAGLERLERNRGRSPPARLVDVITWAIPLISVVPFLGMEEDVLGPDTSEGLLPAAPVIGFYAMFFFFGALLFRSPDGAGPIDRIGRRWPLHLLAGGAVFAILYADLAGGIAVVLEVLVAWLVSFGMIGLFRRHLAQPSYRVRWLSDSSYWMYLMHLPLVFVFQGVVAALSLPSVIGFVLVVLATVAVLAPSYHGLVRYSPIGRLLNGPRTRDGDARLRTELEAISRSGR